MPTWAYILIARLGNKDLINMSNASYLSIQEAPTCCLLEIINDQLLLIRINLLSLACWCQFWRMTLNPCWKCQSWDTKLPGNGILAWWWFLVLGFQILFQGLLEVIFFFLRSFSCLYSCWNQPWHVYQVAIGVPQDNLNSCITVSQLKLRASKQEYAFLIITEWSWQSLVGFHTFTGMELRVQYSKLANLQSNWAWSPILHGTYLQIILNSDMDVITSMGGI